MMEFGLKFHKRKLVEDQNKLYNVYKDKRAIEQKSEHIKVKQKCKKVTIKVNKSP